VGRRRVGTEFVREKRRILRMQERENLLRMIRDSIRKRVREYLRRRETRREKYLELFSTLRDLYTKRGAVLFVVRKQFIFGRKYTAYYVDKILSELSENERAFVVEALRTISETKNVSPELILSIPYLRWVLWSYVAYYTKEPCKHNAYIVKITPITLRYYKGQQVTYYVLRWARAEDVKADPYIGRTKPVDLYVSLFRYKFDPETLASLVTAGTGTADPNDHVALARDHYRNPKYEIPLRRAVFQPHWVKRAFSKEIGKPEMYYSVDHCSVYAMFRRWSSYSRTYITPHRRILGKRPRHRIKEVLYYMGLRV